MNRKKSQFHGTKNKKSAMNRKNRRFMALIGNAEDQILATPVLLAASATALETAGATLGSNALGMM